MVNSDVWNHLGVMNHVAIYAAKVAHTKLNAMRLVLVINKHISDVYGTFLDTDLAYNWTYAMSEFKEMKYLADQVMEYDTPFEDYIPATGAQIQGDVFAKELNKMKMDKKWVSVDNSAITHDLSYMRFDFSKFPKIADRDVLFERRFNVTAHPVKGSELVSGQVIVDYHSVNDRRMVMKDSKECERAYLPHMQWRFLSMKRPLTMEDSELAMKEFPYYSVDGLQSVYSDLIYDKNYKGPQTLIDIEAFADPKGAIPPFVMDYLGKDWPSQCMNQFRKLCNEGGAKPYKGLVDW
jgi:hypothetical protein